jgi:glycosyltransferase involved in cell wall biosynthesis
VLLEAQEARLPIVSFDCPTGPSEIIEDNENGFLVPTYNIEEMAEKILKLMEEKETRKRFSDNSQKNIENFSKRNIIKKWKDIIDTI